MGKNIYIGDIHGRDVWRQIVAENEDADNIVFIGDYFDSFDIPGVVQLRNARDIVEFKKIQELDLSKKVYLLIGNHDHHYWPGVKERGSTSGFNANMMYQFEEFFRENKEHFQMSVLIGNCLCTHAGVSSKYMEDFGYWKGSYEDESHVADWLNDLFKYQPNKFLFTAGYDMNNTGFSANGYGDDEWQNPLWIRPRSLQRVNKNTELKNNYIQIVGHTQQDHIDIKGKATGGRYYYIDTLPSGEYLIEEDGEFKVGYCAIVKYI
jgi:UDP-2,3-diacylglucosamine pyrophosphatase LpxH